MSNQNTTEKDITNQINNINAINSNPNPNSYLDLIINPQITQQVTKFNAVNGFNFSNISILIMLLSITELRTFTKNIFYEFSSFIKNNHKPFFAGIYNNFNN